MARTKRPAKKEEKPATPAALRVTRSETGRAANVKSVDSASASTPKKKRKRIPKAKKDKETEEETKEEQTKGGETKEVKGKSPMSGKKKTKAKASDDVGEPSNKRTIVIEHCKQCNSFKTRAIQVKDGLDNAIPGVTVLLNPDKPRRGCFEIREEGGETFISLLNMKRPFTRMKALDMNNVISDVIDKIKL